MRSFILYNNCYIVKISRCHTSCSLLLRTKLRVEEKWGLHETARATSMVVGERRGRVDGAESHAGRSRIWRSRSQASSAAVYIKDVDLFRLDNQLTSSESALFSPGDSRISYAPGFEVDAPRGKVWESHCGARKKDNHTISGDIGAIGACEECLHHSSRPIRNLEPSLFKAGCRVG